MRVCASESHKSPVEATVQGRFRNPWNHAQDADAEYCATCAALLELVGSFTPAAVLPGMREIKK